VKGWTVTPTFLKGGAEAECVCRGLWAHAINWTYSYTQLNVVYFPLYTVYTMYTKV
jgi:hypothetical protein